jgi:PAS domain S-box-containing protein
MTWYPNPYVIVLAISTLLTGGVMLYAWRRRAMGGITPSFTLLGVTIWTLGYAVAMGVHDLEGRIFWAKVQHVGIAIAPVAMVAFVVRYTGHTRWLTWRNLALVAAVPFVGMVLAWTNEAHGLIWANAELVNAGSVVLLRVEYGPYFWFYAAYNHLVLFSSALLFLLGLLRSPPPHRGQAAVMLIGTLCPGVANLLYLARLNPLPALDLTPFGYGLGALALAWGAFRYQLFDVVPVARGKVIENMADGLIVLDAWDRVVDANPAALRLLGRSVEDVIGRPAEQVLSGQLDLAQRYSGAREVRAEIVLDSDQGQCYHDLRITPLTDRRGYVTGRLIVLRDVTKRVQAEKDLRRYTAELEASNAELDAFAHTVAHDLKGPLGVVVGYSESLETPQADLEPDMVRYVSRRIVRAAYKMADIIDGLLLLASVRQADEVETGPLDMGAIVSEALGRFESQIQQKHVRVIVPDEWPTALGYALWVEVVWANYIENALKYGGNPEAGTVSCIALGFEELDSHIRFWVRDDGPGLTEAQQAQLFTQFTRLHVLHAEGHGLGLSIVQRIAERLGGKAGMESEPGQGSTFYFTLPRWTGSS